MEKQQYVNTFNINSNLSAKAVINLQPLGIHTTVLTTIGHIEELMTEFDNQPDKIWCNGLGKQYMYKTLLRELKKQDLYFTKHPNKVKLSNSKWIEFCDDCLILFVLDAFLNGQIVKLMHPDQYKAMVKNTAFEGATGDMPDLIEGIPTLN